MKIAFVLSGFPKTPKTFILNQIAGLIDKGHKVYIFSETIPENPADNQLIRDYSMLERTVYFDPPRSIAGAIRETPIDLFHQVLDSKNIQVLKYIKEGKKFPKTVRSLNKWRVRDQNYDIVHFHFGPTALDYCHLLDKTDAKSLVTFYGSDVAKFPVGNRDVYEGVFEGMDHIIAITEDMKQNLKTLGCREEKIEVIKLGIDIEQFEFSARKKEEDEPYKILTVGRFVEKKGIKYGLEAIAELKDEYDIEYNIVGDGELSNEIEEKIRELNLQEEVTLHGYVEYAKMRDMMYENHILLAPSVTAEDGDKEGAPMVIIEAQATGMPVISTRHAGIPEIVKDGESAYLAEERNSKELAEKLQKMLKESDQWRDKGLVGRKKIEQAHSVEQMTENVENLYRN